MGRSFKGEREGENSGDGKIGSIAEVRGVGDNALPFECGGGVVEDRRGEEWFEGRGDKAGDEGPGEVWSAGVLDCTADCLYTPVLRLGVDESSTSFKRDCRKLGAAALFSAVVGGGRVGLEDSACSAASARSCGLLVRGRFSFRSGAGSGS